MDAAILEISNIGRKPEVEVRVDERETNMVMQFGAAVRELFVGPHVCIGVSVATSCLSHEQILVDL